MDLPLVAEIFDVLQVSPPEKLILLDARTLRDAHVAPYPPDTSALFTNVDSRELALHLKDVLLTTYPKLHVVFTVYKGKKEEKILSEFGNEEFSERFALYVPLLGEGTSFESFAEIVAHLRAPNGCPWDKEQTHESLRKHFLDRHSTH